MICGDSASLFITLKYRNWINSFYKLPPPDPNTEYIKYGKKATENMNFEIHGYNCRFLPHK